MSALVSESSGRGKPDRLPAVAAVVLAAAVADAKAAVTEAVAAADVKAAVADAKAAAVEMVAVAVKAVAESAALVLDTECPRTPSSSIVRRSQPLPMSVARESLP